MRVSNPKSEPNPTKKQMSMELVWFNLYQMPQVLRQVGSSESQWLPSKLSIFYMSAMDQRIKFHCHFIENEF
jgi:hypothetical protein